MAYTAGVAMGGGVAHVVFQTADGAAHRLVHGDVIGRDPGAALALPDRRISVAHAAIALRPRGLALLSLRGEVRLGRRRVDDVLLDVGQRFVLPDGTALVVVEVDHGTGALPLDATDRPAVAPLTVTARFEVVEITGGDLARPVVITGIGALILCALIRAGEPTHWYRIARQVWPPAPGRGGAAHKEAIRARWYQATARLRRELEAAGVRPLVTTRAGTVALTLLPGDRVLDDAD